MISALGSPAATHYVAPFAPEATPVHADDFPQLDPSDVRDAAMVMFLLMMNGQQAHDRSARGEIDSTSGLKAKERAKELEDFQKQIKMASAKGFFESIGNLVADTFKAMVTGDFDKLSDDVKDMADSPKFWSDLQKVAAVVAEVASVVVSAVTLGAGSASVVAVTAFVIGTVLSTAAMVEQNFHVLEQLTKNPEFAKWFAIGCMIGSAICNLTGAIANGVTEAAKQGIKTSIEEGAGEIAKSVVASPGALANGLTTAAKQAADIALKNPTVWDSLVKIATMTKAVADVVGGVATAGAAVVQYDADQTSIDAEKRKQRQTFLQNFISNIVEHLKGQEKDNEKDLKQARENIATVEDTQLLAATMLRA